MAVGRAYGDCQSSLFFSRWSYGGHLVGRWQPSPVADFFFFQRACGTRPKIGLALPLTRGAQEILPVADDASLVQERRQETCTAEIERCDCVRVWYIKAQSIRFATGLSPRPIRGKPPRTPAFLIFRIKEGGRVSCQADPGGNPIALAGFTKQHKYCVV